MLKVTTLTAPEIECQGCVESIQKSLQKIAGIQDIHVDIETKSIVVTHDSIVSPESIKIAVKKSGFSTL